MSVDFYVFVLVKDIFRYFFLCGVFLLVFAVVMVKVEVVDRALRLLFSSR